MRIPLPKLMRHWREREFERHLTPATVRSGLQLWGFFAKRPALYRLATRVAMGALGFAGRRRGRFAWLPLARGWTKYRDFPAPQGETFQAALEARAQGSRRMSARDDIFANIRRSLGVNGSENDPPADRGGAPGARAQGRDPRSAVRSRARSGSPCSRPWPRASLATVTEVASAAEVPQSIALFLRNHNLPATLAHGRRSAPRGHALGGDHPRDRPRSERRRRPQRREPRLRRRRRNRHAGDGLGPREPLDPQLPARQPHHRGLGQGHRRRLREPSGTGSASPTARAPCRAR